MTEELHQGDGIAPKHAHARRLAELAVEAQAAGDDDRAELLFAEAEKTDPEAVAAFLADRAADPCDTATSADAERQDDDEVAAMSRTVQPGSAAPSRAGITGAGSGADDERR
jgi:hypothetical protein